MLRILHSEHFSRGTDLKITDLAKLDIAVTKLIQFAQLESNPVEVETLITGQSLQKRK